MTRTSTAVRLLVLCGILSLSFLTTGCEYFSSPQNTFAPAGEVAQDQKDQFLFVTWPALVIGVLVMVGLVYIMLRFRRKPGDPGLPKQVHGHTALELSWTILPAVLLAVIAVPTVTGIRKLARDPADDALLVNVSGARFSWDFAYAVDPEGEPLFGEPNVLTIPVGREIGLTIDSVDVNHSFWIPKLAGKTDAIANHTNKMWLKATRTGTFEGQCAEFCGLDHSLMRFKVNVVTQDQFGDYVEGLRAAASADDSTGGDEVSAASGE